MFSIKTEPIRDTHTHTHWFGQNFCLLFFGKWLWKNPNELFGQPSIYIPMHIQRDRDREREIYFKEITHNFGD